MLVGRDQRHICLSPLWLLKSSLGNNCTSPVHSTIVFLVISMFSGLVSYTAVSLKFDLQTSFPVKTRTSRWQLPFTGTTLPLCYCFNFNLRWILLHIFSTEMKGKNLYTLWDTIYCFDVTQCFNQQASVCISPQLWFFRQWKHRTPFFWLLGALLSNKNSVPTHWLTPPLSPSPPSLW